VVSNFKGYGDDSIDCDLRDWTNSSRITQVQSDLTAAVSDAVHATGLSFPFPRGEVPLPQDGAGGTLGAR